MSGITTLTTSNTHRERQQQELNHPSACIHYITTLTTSNTHRERQQQELNHPSACIHYITTLTTSNTHRERQQQELNHPSACIHYHVLYIYIYMYVLSNQSCLCACLNVVHVGSIGFKRFAFCHRRWGVAGALCSATTVYSQN